MNILLLSQFFSATRGGGEYLFNLLAKEMADHNHRVYVITNDVRGEKYTAHENIKVIRVSPTLVYEGGLPAGLIDNIRYVVNVIKIGVKLVKKEKVDVIHSNNFSPCLAGAILSIITSRPHITSIWDIFTLCGSNYWKKWTSQSGISVIQAVLGPRFEKMTTKLPSKIIHTISDASKEDLLKFGTKKPIIVIPPAIEKTEKTSLETNPFQFVYVGRLVFYKNVEVIIKAIKIVSQSEPQVKLVIIGGGPHKTVLQKMINELHLEDNVIFLGFVDTRKKFEIIASSNSLLFPSLCEGFGLVILEAFSHNKPVIVSNKKPMSDIVNHGKNGYVLDPYDEHQWSEYILKLIKEPEIAHTMGEDGGNMMQTRYNLENMYKMIMHMYETALEN
jgi:glycosyltransferase involved in cell wall biosynthesis